MTESIVLLQVVIESHLQLKIEKRQNLRTVNLQDHDLSVLF